MNSTQTHSPSILITDDNPVNIQIIYATLLPVYSNLIEAKDGEACIEILKEQAIDLLLLDMNMPKLSGLEVLQIIPSLHRRHRPRVMVVSSDNSPETVARAFQMGADDYLTTPYSREEMLARVQTQLSLRRRAQYLEELVASRTRELSETNQKLKETHRQLMQAEKMASLGQLAAGIAHEINNPIAYINSNLQTLAEYCIDFSELIEAFHQLPEDFSDKQPWQDLKTHHQNTDSKFLISDAKKLLGDSLKGVERVIQIVNDLKIFSHPEQSNWQAGDLNACMDSALNIISNNIKYKARVIKDYGELPSVECIFPQINQVFVNLLVNAAQAIDEFGEIIITTRQLNNDTVEVKINDTGSGIPPELIDKIYDPFFTTKPVGVGTGLGLSITYSIIENHNGTIKASNIDTIGDKKGTSFTIHLPIRHKQTSNEQRQLLET